MQRDHWRRSPAAQQFMRDKGLTHEGQIQQHFTNRMADFLAGKKRRIMGWDEILEDGANPSGRRGDGLARRQR